MNELFQAYQFALEKAGVPTNLASQCAEIVQRDDPHALNLGRSEEDQRLISSASEWMKAKQTATETEGV
ncbi:MAG: hypothetical protein AB1861_29450 [Cyanobacteriota bacterium]